jgi:transcriptional regulator with XRE-family HTH domain
MEKQDILNEFGRNLRAERNRKRYSQEKLAELANLSDYSHVGKIERAEMSPTITTVINLMLALDISFEDLFDIDKFKGE